MRFADKPIQECTIISIDLEASGPYPLSGEICEFAGIKWRDGKRIDSYTTLIKPERKMGEKIIAIHGISNDMVKDAPAIADVSDKIYEFIKDGIVLAHHSPFDIGFLTIEFEKSARSLSLPPALCSSLLSIELIKDSPDHKLQTLIKFLAIDGGTAHRAYDDANAALSLFEICLEKVTKQSPQGVMLSDLIKIQGKDILWKNFSIEALEEEEKLGVVINAIKSRNPVEILYGGSSKGKMREIYPLGMVRNPDSDFLVGYCTRDQRPKRFYLKKLQAVKRLQSSTFPSDIAGF